MEGQFLSLIPKEMLYILVTSLNGVSWSSASGLLLGDLSMVLFVSTNQVVQDTSSGLLSQDMHLLSKH